MSESAGPADHYAPYACRPEASRGRLVAEPESPTRSCFQRDRDRIIHSGAFRRLKYKTQVFVYHEGDYYRTRLTHSIEVAQIARSVSRALALNEDLAPHRPRCRRRRSQRCRSRHSPRHSPDRRRR